MHLEMTNDEHRALRDVLAAVLSDMSMEIADTDNAGYRAGLRERRALLQSIQAKLDGGSRQDDA